MALESKEILVPLADQTLTTGAAYSGDVVSTIPEDFDQALALLTGLTASGYLSEDGIALSTSLSLSDFKEMNRGTVRRGLDDFTGTVNYTELQIMNETVLKRKFGAAAVSVIAATASAGKKIRVKVGASLAPIQTFAFKLKDGDARAIVWIPRGQVTNGIDITFAANSMASVPMEVSAYDNGDADNIYLFFDDGTTVSATVQTTLSALTIGSLTGSLTPSFDKDVHAYTATASGSTSTITATASDTTNAAVLIRNGNETVASGGSATWADGENKVVITVVNGSKMGQYVVTVTASVE